MTGGTGCSIKKIDGTKYLTAIAGVDNIEWIAAIKTHQVEIDILRYHQAGDGLSRIRRKGGETAGCLTEVIDQEALYSGQLHLTEGREFGRAEKLTGLHCIAIAAADGTVGTESAADCNVHSLVDIGLNAV